MSAEVTQQELEAIATELGDEHDPVTVNLTSLARAVGGGDRGDRWSRVDLRQIFDANTIARRLTPPLRYSRRAQLDHHRTWLILVPIIVTWIGIAAAALAYYDTVKDGSSLESRSFLYLWQGGFDGRLPFLKLSDIAIVDVLLMLGLVVVTLLAQGRAEQEEDAWRERHARQSQRIASVLAEATLCLAGQPAHQPADIVRRFEDTASALIGTLRTTQSSLVAETSRYLDQLSTVAAQRDGELRTLANVTAGISNGTDQMAAAAKTMQASVPRLETTINRLALSVTSLSEHQAQLVEEVSSMRSSATEIVTQQQEHTDRIDAALTRIDATVAIVTNAHAELLASTDALVASQQTLVAEIGAERRAQDASAVAVAAAAQQLLSAMKQADEYERFYTGITVDLTRLNASVPQAVDALARLLLAQATVTHQISSAGNTMHESAQALQRLMIDLARTADASNGRAPHATIQSPDDL